VTITVIAVDPAPRKKSTLFQSDGFEALSSRDLAQRLEAERTRGKVLVCWDSPLTGPSEPNRVGTRPYDYSQRVIERFFSRSETGFKVPPGISVRPYSGCPHWALSRAILGLPRVGRFDLPTRSLPFRHIAEGEYPKKESAAVVEVHPAVALWVWLSPRRAPGSSWEYKKNESVLRELIRLFSDIAESKSPEPRTDDELDALVAFTLGSWWASGKGDVVLLGDAASGSFLVPAASRLVAAYDRFRHETSG
jgi:hypothetical protein